MAKSVNAKDPALEADVLNMAGVNKAGTDTAGQQGGEVNQDQGKQEGENLGNQGTTQTAAAGVQAGQQVPGKELYGGEDGQDQARADMREFLAFKKQKQAAAEKAQAEQEKNKITAEDHTALVKRYGQGYVRARRGKEIQFFTKRTWENLGGNTAGWAKVTDTPPEVAHLAK